MCKTCFSALAGVCQRTAAAAASHSVIAIFRIDCSSPRCSSCCGNSPVDRGAASSPGWKPRDVEPKLAQTQGCGRHGMATIIEGRESGFKTNPDYKITFEPSPRRVRVQLNGEWIADST